jgi:hypothetical protein
MNPRTPCSGHARTRMQQRSISPLVAEWIMDFGTSRRSRGAEFITLDRKGRKRLREHVGHSVYNQISSLLGTVVVLADDGTVITAAHRRVRLRDR